MRSGLCLLYKSALNRKIERLEVGVCFMSWDKFKFRLIAKCPCGHSLVERIVYEEENDFSQCRSGIISEQIICPICSTMYHIEHRKSYCYKKWRVSDGIIDIAYCVPNGISIQGVDYDDFVLYFQSSCFELEFLDKKIIDCK